MVNRVNEFGLIVMMAAVTYATRILGFLAVHWIGPAPLITRWSDRIANLVLAVILAKILLAAPQSIWVGVAVATVVMLVTSRFLLSMWLGVAVVALGRAMA